MFYVLFMFSHGSESCLWNLSIILKHIIKHKSQRNIHFIHESWHKVEESWSWRDCSLIGYCAIKWNKKPSIPMGQIKSL